MRLKEKIRPLVPDFVIEYSRRRNREYDRFRFSPQGDSRRDIVDKYDYRGELLDMFAGNTGHVVHKWHHYIPLYERYFERFRGTPVRFLEIGVSQGGSLRMWREYFGPEAIIFGIDIDPACRVHDGIAGEVRIGSQVDRPFLEKVVQEMGGIDVVLDDGSHHMREISVSLGVLFPHLSEGGLYMVEDLHTAYWRRYGGGRRASGNFFRYLLGVVDDMHHWYHGGGLRVPDISRQCTGFHVHDSIVVIEKGKVHPPVHSEIGQWHP